MIQTARGALRRADEIRDRAGADGAELRELRDRAGALVPHHTLVPGAQQPPHHVAAHPAETDHSKLHDCSLKGAE